MARLDLVVNVLTKGDKELSGLSQKLGQTGKALTIGVTAPLIAAGAAAFNFASDMQEASSKAETVYGRSVDKINAASESMTDAFSEAEFKDTAGTFGALLKNMGFTADAAADLSVEWIGLAGDMASFHNSDPSESLQAIQSALAGEFEPLKRFGVALNVATIEQKALEMGLWDGEGALTAQARALVIQAELTRQQSDVVGDYARTSEGAANSGRTLVANFQDMAGQLGQNLLPIGTQLIQMLNSWVSWFSGLPEPVKSIVVQVAALAVAIGPLLLVGSKLVGTFQAVGSAFSALKLLLLANPFVALAAAVVALVALVVLNWDKITAVFRGALRFITETGKKLWTPVSQGFTAAIGVIRGAWNSFARWWNSLKISVPSFDVPFVGKVGGFSIGLPKLPQLAEGGIVTGPTLALIGERGPEAVVPLDGRGFGEYHTHIHIENHGPPVQEEDDIVTLLQAMTPYLDGRLAAQHG